MAIFKTHPLLWEQNEDAGFRSIHAVFQGNTVVAFIANKTQGSWTAQVVPMGYSYTRDDVEFLASLYSQAQFIINILEQEERLDHADVLTFLDNLHV